MNDDERIAALEAAVAELRRQVDAMRTGRTMRQTHRCPACGCGRVLHFPTVADENGPQPATLSLQKVQHFFSRDRTGALEAFVCQRCLLVEWHAVTLEDVIVNGRDVVELVAEDGGETYPDGPYR